MRSDRELAAQVAAGDRDAALAELIERHGVMLERTVRRLVKDPQLADDVCQAVLIVLVQKAGSLTAEGSLGGWLHRTAVLAARDTLRQEARRKQREEEAARRMMQNRNEPPAELPEGFDEALERLPSVYREALVMRYLEGRSRTEIAAALKLNEGAVDTRISRGVDRLRKALAGAAGSITAPALTQALSAEATTAGAIKISAATAAALTAVSTGKAGTGAVTAAKGAMKAMFWIKMKTAAAAVVLTVTIALTGVGAVHWVRAEESPTKDAAKPPEPGEIKFEDVTPKSGIQREKAPKVKGKDENDVSAMKDGIDYFDWPFDAYCGDLDGDGHLDVISSDHHAAGRTPGGIWLGKGNGTFTSNIILRTPIEDAVKKDVHHGIGGALGTVLDVNGDGRMDFICTEGRGVYLNEGLVGEGETRSVKFKLVQWGGARGWTFADYNRDGNLDVAIGWGSAVCFGGGKGTEPSKWKVSAQAADEIKKWEDPFHHCISADFRRSGSQDILGGQAVWRWAWTGTKEGRKEPRGILMVNDGKGNFTESAEAYGLAEMSSTGPIVAADFNNRGFFDIFSEGLGNADLPAKARFFFNEQGKKFTQKDLAEMGIKIKLSVNGLALQYCCASAVDLDNDGLLDLVVGQHPDSKIRIFQNLGNYKFRELAGLPSQGGGEARFTAADINEDGLLDLVLNGGAVGLQIHLNRSVNDNGWLEVAVKGKAGNIHGMGALVELFQPGKLGDRSAYLGMQHVVAETQNHVPLAPHFGLGKNMAADVRVTLPTGEVLETKSIGAKNRLVADFEANTFAPRKQ